VHREVYREVPPKVEYSLTEFGVSLNEALAPLGAWGKKHLKRIVATRHPVEV
jgi:DNA-binding HxlR family transcriptional regulator